MHEYVVDEYVVCVHVGVVQSGVHGASAVLFDERSRSDDVAVLATEKVEFFGVTSDWVARAFW